MTESENRARLSMTALWWRRRDLSPELATRYWRDVHGTAGARLPGQWLYRQLHCAPVAEGLFPQADPWPDGEEPAGIANVLYLDADTLAGVRGHPLIEHLIADNWNMIDRNATYWTADGNARTYVDRTADPAPQGPVAHPGFALLFRRRDASPVETFRDSLRELAEGWSGMEGVLRVRLALLEPAPDVAEQHDAWIDLVVDDERRVRDLAHDGAHVLAVRERYTMVHEGRPTEVGLRGYPAVQTIEAAGAASMREPALLELLYGRR